MKREKIEQYYKILELKNGASLSEIKSAYKQLSFVWHPDRFLIDNEELINKANNKIKEINDACT